MKCDIFRWDFVNCKWNDHLCYTKSGQQLPQAILEILSKSLVLLWTRHSYSLKANQVDWQAQKIFQNLFLKLLTRCWHDTPKPIILRFASYADREMVLSNAYKLAGSKWRIVNDLPVIMKLKRKRLSNEAYKIRKSENLQTRIKDKGLSMYLQVRKNK